MNFYHIKKLRVGGGGGSEWAVTGIVTDRTTRNSSTQQLATPHCTLTVWQKMSVDTDRN
jgi:hypothetical protein